ncbi:MAG: aminotransferase class III-fold pyridoxal phosphate-dependent enzyme [Gemmatimonadota bacterium]|nr:aminotransferase class III-fold pyridoxal phosphate-dependent enzyme [Gemmatimonadota bacterium]
MTINDRIPGFTSTGSKRPDALFGSRAGDAELPRRMTSANGCRVRDDRGREYVDFIMGLGSVALGYAHPAVTRAAVAAVEAGVIGPLPPEAERAAAERIGTLMPWMEQVRFLKSGAEAMSAAVRLARAHTGRDLVLACGYHGWHDWCQGEETGVPQAVAALTHRIPFNDAAASAAAIREAAGALAAVVVEPVIEAPPDPEWLATVREEAHRAGAVLVYDEIKTACRVAVGGAAERWGVKPDLMVVGKAIANGFPLAAVGGSAAVMEAAHRTWISSTTATEFVSLEVCRATLGVLVAERVPERLGRLGSVLYDGFAALASRHPDQVRSVIGMPEMCALAFRTEEAGARAAAGCAHRGILFKRGAYNFVSAAHSGTEINLLLDTLSDVLGNTS